MTHFQTPCHLGVDLNQEEVVILVFMQVLSLVILLSLFSIVVTIGGLVAGPSVAAVGVESTVWQ